MRPIVLAFSVSWSALADPGSMFGADKAKHFFLGAFTQSMGHAVLRTAGAGDDIAIAGAWAGTLAAGVGKEIHDRRSGGTADWRDVVWTAGGAGAVTPLLLRTR